MAGPWEALVNDYREYRVERLAFRIKVRGTSVRLGRSNEAIERTCTRWMQRWGRSHGVVVGTAKVIGREHVERGVFDWTYIGADGGPWLAKRIHYNLITLVAPGCRDVQPDDRSAVASLIDGHRGYIRVAVIPPLSALAWRTGGL